MRTTTGESPQRRATRSRDWISSALSLLAGLPRRRLSNSPRKFFLLGRHAKGFGNLNTGFEADEPRFRLPGFRIGLRVVDGQVELNRVLIDATITLDRAHLIAVRLP